MPTCELRREPASQVEHSFDVLSELALKAESLLGYSGLRQRLGVPPATLTETLEQLDIEPFRTEDVKRYKSAKAEEVENQIWAEFTEKVKLEGLGPGGLIGSFVRAYWRRVELSRYGGDIPAFAISRAVEIKQRLPQALFYVEELIVDKQYDPFLLVQCGRERFYVDVWDERDFEREHA